MSPVDPRVPAGHRSIRRMRPGNRSARVAPGEPGSGPEESQPPAAEVGHLLLEGVRLRSDARRRAGLAHDLEGRDASRPAGTCLPHRPWDRGRISAPPQARELASAVRPVLRDVAGLLGNAGAVARDLARSRAALLAENALLRQQLAAATHQLRRAQPSRLERLAISLLARFVPWRQRAALYLVTPETLVRWQRETWAHLWRWRSRPARHTARRQITREALAAIGQMARENPGWGAKRIVGELGKLEISVCKRTVQRILRQVRPRGPRAGQAWATFVRNHLDVTWACDFFTVPVGVCSQLYVFFVLDLGTRRVLHWNVTANPTDEWLAHQAREVTAWGQGPRFLIRDRDGKFGARFDAVFQSTGARVLLTPPRTPVANCFAERWVGTARRLLFDHLIVLGEAHLRVHMARLVAHYNAQRPHQGLDQRIPDEVRAPREPPRSGPILGVPVLGGLTHHYERAA